MAEILRSRGHMVTASEGAREALGAWRTDRHPLVVLDWVLGEGSGLELCRGLRGEPGGDRPVILVVTGKREPPALEEVLAAGADDYVAKPFDVALLNVRLAVAENSVRARSEWAEAEAALERATGEIQAPFWSLGDVFFSVDLEADRLIQISPSVESIYGIPPADILAAGRWSELIPGHDPKAIRAGLEEGEGERSVVVPISRESVGGEPQWLEASLRAGRRAGGRVVRIDGVISDVSERQRNQIELAARNQELRTLHQISEITLLSQSLEEGFPDILEIICRDTGSPLAAVEWKEEGQPVLRLLAARGVPMAELAREPFVSVDDSLSGSALLSRAPQVLSDASLRPHVLCPLIRKVGKGTVLAFPILMRGEAVGVLTLARPEVFTPDERLLRWGSSLANYIATFMDRVGAVAALRENEARYRTLTEELQRANRELEAFAYTVSHDLRAPLRTMEGFAHTLLSRFGEQLDPEASDYARRILASGELAERLIEDLLTYSRVSIQELEPTAVDLSDVVSVALAQLEDDVRVAKATVEVEGALPVVGGHHTTLVQVVANLVSNAVKFAREGVPPEVRIRAEPMESEVRLWVEDNGTGVPPEQTKRIFRTFERLTKTQSRPGTGIGLAIVRRGMERMGGSAGVEPGASHGSRFWIQLPNRSDA